MTATSHLLTIACVFVASALNIPVLCTDCSPIAFHQQDDGDVEDDMTIREVGCCKPESTTQAVRVEAFSQSFKKGTPEN